VGKNDQDLLNGNPKTREFRIWYGYLYSLKTKASPIGLSTKMALVCLAKE
jgi:hypothetical protein